MIRSRLIVCTLALITLALALSTAGAEDWPMYRYDVGRTAATPMELPAELHLQWTRQLPEPQPAWTAERKRFDTCYQPIVAGKLMLIGSNSNDSVTAYDTKSGIEKWRFFCDGPVRLAPVVADGKVYFGSDDGYLYCLDLQTGREIWKSQGALRDRNVLGNKRIISSWPVRCAPIVADGKVFFTAGIFPSMGVSRYQLDATTGKVIWQSDETLTTSHQGYPALIDGQLVVPGGRARPIFYDWQTGQYTREISTLFGTPFVSGIEGLFIQNHWITGKAMGKYEYGKPNLDHEFPVESPGFMEDAVLTAKTFYTVLDPDRTLNRRIYFYASTIKEKKQYYSKIMKGSAPGDLIKIDTEAVRRSWVKVPLDEDLERTEALKKRRAILKEIEDKFYSSIVPVKLPVKLKKIWLKAGSRLYASDVNQTQVVAIDLAKGSVSWQEKLPAPIVAMIAGDDKLFIITDKSQIFCFGGEKKEIPAEHASPDQIIAEDKWTKCAADILSATAQVSGNALVLGVQNVRLWEALASQSELHITAIVPDAEKVAEYRKALDDRWLYGRRVEVHVGDPLAFHIPPYVHSLILVSDSQ
ncbi:MAG TPA: hypothetical protein ENL03_02945, partial [Phycisphaerae bacterium]|nr:hypothetical protein [Phycisphaerae bacterium]